MHVAGTVPRVWPCRAPPRGASGRVAKTAGSGIRPRSISTRARAPRPNALRPLSHGSHGVSRTIVCATSARTVRTWRALCRACGRAVRRRAVRRVAPRFRGSKFTCGLFRPARARVPQHCAHCRVGRPTCRAPSCAPRARAWYACRRHNCAARVAVPWAAARCVGSRREPRVRNPPVEYFLACARPVRRHPAPPVAWVALRVAHQRVRHERAHRVHVTGTTTFAWSRRAPPRGASVRAAKPRGQSSLHELSSSRARPVRHAHGTRVAGTTVPRVWPCRGPPRGASGRAANRGDRIRSRNVFVPRESRAPCGAPTAAWAAPRVALRRVRHEPAHVRASQAPCRACCRAVRRRVVRRFAPRPAGSELAREPPTAAWVAPRVAHRRVRHEHGPRIRYVPTRGEASSQPLSHGATRAAQGAAVSRYVGSTHVA
jgi:hypothetical protein